MNSKTTGIWFVIAAGLFAFIFVFERYFHQVPAGPAPLLPGMHPAAITSIQLSTGVAKISARRANGGWLLTEPVVYPAQTAAIGALLDALQKLAPEKISAAELREHKDAEAEFGFENPQALLTVSADDRNWQLKIGNKTAPGDQVYLRLSGADGVFVADAGWLNLLPHVAEEWRDTSLVDAEAGNCNWIVLTNNDRGITIELRRDPTNHLWRMVRPLQARADAGHITDALQRLQSAIVTRFVADDPKDLTTFGLQPADLDLWLGRGTNQTAVHIGRSPTNDATQVYAKREGWNTVFTTANDTLSPWRGMVNDFRDTRLFELTAPVAEIEVRGDKQFLLRQHGSNQWEVAGEKFPVEAGSVQAFVKKLADLRITDFVKDAVTASNLPDYGLATPRREIILRSKAGDTNSVIADLQFGATQDDKMFARCGDENNFIYDIQSRDFESLPGEGWEFRSLNIWDFKAEDVAQITIHQGGMTRHIVHNGPGKWSLAAGSQGIIEGKYIEQAVEQFRQLSAVGWFTNNLTDPEKWGFSTNNLQITFELKSGATQTVDLGMPISNGKGALAAVTLDGARWAFVLAPAPYQYALSFLAIPAASTP